MTVEEPPGAPPPPRARRLRRLLKVTAWGVSGLLLLACGLLALLQLRPVQRAAVRVAAREAGRVLKTAIEVGSLDLDLLHGTVEVRDVTLRGQAERAGTLATLSRLSARVSTRELLRGRVLVERVEAEGLGARLAVDRDGKLLLPLVVPASPEKEKTGRPDVVVTSLRLSGGWLELEDRGPAARHLAVKQVSLVGDLRLRELASTGSLALGSIEAAAPGAPAIPGSTLSASWETSGGTARLTATVAAREAGLEARLEGEARGLPEKPGYTATLTASGTLGPMAARLVPSLGLAGTVDVKVRATGEGAAMPALAATLAASEVTVAGRSLDKVDASAELSNGKLTASAVEVAAGAGRLRAEISGLVLPAPKDLAFRLRASRVDVGPLLPAKPGAPRLAGVLDGTVEGRMARPELAAITAAASLSLAGSMRRAGGTVAPDVAARLTLANGVVTAESFRLADRDTRADLSGSWDRARSSFSAKVDATARDLGPYLALAGLRGKGSLEVHLKGSGSLSRPDVEGRLAARGVVVGGAAVECVELDASASGSRFVVTNAAVSAYGVDAGVDARGTLPLPGAKAPQVDLSVRGIRYRGRGYPDLSAHVALGPTIDARLRTADGRVTAHAVVPAGGGWQVEAAADGLPLFGLAALVPEHLADVDGSLTARVEAASRPGAPLSARVVLDALTLSAAGRSFAARDAEALLAGDSLEVKRLDVSGDDGSRLALSGRGTLDGSLLDWRLLARVPDLAAFTPLVPGLDPLAGRLSADVTLTGSLARPRAAGTVAVRDLLAGPAALARLDATLGAATGEGTRSKLTVAGLRSGAYKLDDGELDVTWAGNGVTARGRLHGGRLGLDAKAALDGARPFEATVQADGLDLAPFARAAGARAELTASVTGVVKARGTLQDPKRTTVEVRLSALEAAAEGWRIRASEPVQLTAGAGRLDVERLKLEGTGLSLDASGSFPLEGPATGRLAVTSTLDLKALLPFVKALDRAAGHVTARLDVTGNAAAPSFSGSVAVDEALLDGPAFPAPLEKVSGTVALRPDGVTVESLTARFAGGTVAVKGSAGLRGTLPGRVEATLRARDLDLDVGPDLSVNAGADLSVTGDWPKLAVGGEVKLEDVVYVPSIDVMALLKKLTGRARRAPAPEEAAPSPWVPQPTLDVAVTAKDSIHVEGNLGEVELGGSLRVKGTPEAPVVLGAVASTRGTVNLFGSIFDLSRCRIDFADPLAIDPDLDVSASTTKGDEEITMRISGKATSAQLLLSSSKGRSQADIVATLLGGSGESGGSSTLGATAAKMALRGATSPLLGSLGAHTDLQIVPLPTTPEGEDFLFSVGKELGGGLSATYYKGVSGETTDAIELRWRISSRARGRLRQNQDSSFSGGFRIRREFD